MGSCDITGKGLILILGGLFLIWKATKEIHGKIDDGDQSPVGVQNDETSSPCWSSSP